MNFRYHVQAAFYADGYKEVTGQECPTFLFVAQEKKPPYLSAVYMVDEAMIQAGRRAYQEDLATYKSCRETGNWFGISSKPITLTLPAWAKNDQTWE
jgi:exodeoxyribonuclease VIII